MLQTVEPWDLVAQGYSETTMLVFEEYAQKAIALLDLVDNSRVLDVACGPGTLSLLVAEKVSHVDALDFSSNMLAIAQRRAREAQHAHIVFREGDGQALPYEDDSYHAAFSMFGLMFFPDRMKGYKEILRVLKPGGKVAISSWAPVDQSPSMQTMFGAMRAMNPQMQAPQTNLASLENPEFFADEMTQSGFSNVVIHPVETLYEIHSVDEFWQSIVKGAAPITMMKNTLPADQWRAKEQLAIEYLTRELSELPTRQAQKAWVAIAEK